VTRNTPTLINAALQPSQFADERASSLEDQIDQVLRSPGEMRSSAEGAAHVLERDSVYRAAFARAFGVPSDQSVTALRLRQALATFVRTLVATRSRFDRAARGDTAALDAAERRGFTLFMSKGRCGTCHFAPLFGGTTPPLYRASDVEVIGTPVSPERVSPLDSDSGRARIDHQPIHLRAFKTPSLRNVALTAPYMHNGAFRTLEQVMAFYDHGGGAGAGAAVGDQTLAPDSLRLSRSEQIAIIAFMRALTDTAVAPVGREAASRRSRSPGPSARDGMHHFPQMMLEPVHPAGADEHRAPADQAKTGDQSHQRGQGGPRIGDG
jgi:cytochrome c peroxidase